MWLKCTFRNVGFCDQTTVWRAAGGLGNRSTVSDLTQGMVVRPERTGKIQE